MRYFCVGKTTEKSFGANANKTVFLVSNLTNTKIPSSFVPIVMTVFIFKKHSYQIVIGQLMWLVDPWQQQSDIIPYCSVHVVLCVLCCSNSLSCAILSCAWSLLEDTFFLTCAFGLVAYGDAETVYFSVFHSSLCDNK